ncbi:nitronate monooxygenase [Nocardioides pocheonensis]|uniref:Propionate 3-nitronate monooxygenase n=1 Tax=Nocardioides pocheonensis TaxID=661485 RepID=A0A3N0GVH2_9ACTN|nr:nitronate monooxygenase [Nocardioides pocheonensis]RNM16399.1 nitronate monooxygenase [Nocardioides pocheonensis]
MPSPSQTLVPSRLPLVQAPMAGGPSTPELAAAVAAAGGLGYVAAGYLPPEALRERLDRTRALSSAPIGVNLFVPGPREADADAIARYAARLAHEAERFDVALGDPVWDDDAFAAKVDLVASAGVHTATFTFGPPPEAAVATLRRAGVVVGVTVTSRAEAEAAADAGADLLVVQGTEAGGHQGTFDPGEPNSTPLLSALEAVRSLGLPCVAAGGIATAEDVRRVLDAGAVAAQVGTAFLCTSEAGTSAPYRAALLEHRYADTVVTRAFSGRWARGLANRFALEHADAPGGYPQVHHLTRPLRAAATAAGDPDVPNLWAGTGWRSVRAEPVAEVVRRLTADL